MRINIQATGLELTRAISQYAEKRILSLDKFLGEGAAESFARIEVGKMTRHHKQGEIFRAEVNLQTPEEGFRSVAEAEDLYSAIDDVREALEQEILSFKDRRRTLFRRGAALVKDMTKGLARFKWKNIRSRLPRFTRRDK